MELYTFKFDSFNTDESTDAVQFNIFISCINNENNIFVERASLKRRQYQEIYMNC